MCHRCPHVLCTLCKVTDFPVTFLLSVFVKVKGLFGRTLWNRSVYCSWVHNCILYTLVRASWIECNNCPTRRDLFSLLYFCRQLYIFRVLTQLDSYKIRICTLITIPDFLRNGHCCKWLFSSEGFHCRCFRTYGMPQPLSPSYVNVIKTDVLPPGRSYSNISAAEKCETGAFMSHKT